MLTVHTGCVQALQWENMETVQMEGKLFAVVPPKNILNVLSKPRVSEPMCAAEQHRSHRASKKASAAHWQVQEYI